jgi:hypothetical protein
MGLHELLIELIDELLELVVGELGVEDEGGMHFEAAVMQVDATDAARAAEYGEDLARFGAYRALEAGRFHLFGL